MAGYTLAERPSTWVRTRSHLLKAALHYGIPDDVLVVRGPTQHRAVALTFDDGPDEMTHEFLACLAELGVRATFFVIGQHASEHPDVMLEYVRGGHEVASHGYTHRAFPKLSSGELLDELSHTQALLPPSRSPRPLVRPPQGAKTPRSIAQVAAAGYTTVLWSLDSDDCRTDRAEEVVSRVSPARVSPGEIVLLHEFQKWTLQALPGLVKQLRDDGYSFLTVSELLGR